MFSNWLYYVSSESKGTLSIKHRHFGQETPMINIAINYKNQLSANSESTESNLLASPGNPDHPWLLDSLESQASHCSPALLWPLSHLGVLVALLDLVNLQNRRREYSVAKFVQSSTWWKTSGLNLQMGRTKVIIITFQENKPENLLQGGPYDSPSDWTCIIYQSVADGKQWRVFYMCRTNRWYVIRCEHARDIAALLCSPPSPLPQGHCQDKATLGHF